jgi:hypothetical protein
VGGRPIVTTESVRTASVAIDCRPTDIVQTAFASVSVRPSVTTESVRTASVATVGRPIVTTDIVRTATDGRPTVTTESIRTASVAIDGRPTDIVQTASATVGSRSVASVVVVPTVVNLEGARNTTTTTAVMVFDTAVDNGFDSAHEAAGENNLEHDCYSYEEYNTLDTHALVLMTLNSSSDKLDNVSLDLFPDEPVSNRKPIQRPAMLSEVQLFSRNYREVLKDLDASDHTEGGVNYSAADKCIARRRQVLQRTVNEFTNRNHLTLSGSGFTLNALETMQSDETKGSNNNNKDLYHLLCTFLAVEYNSFYYRRFDADPTATTWLIEAVELTRNKYLQYNLGFYYEYGLGGVERDTSRACSLYSLSAKKGHAKALSRLKILDGYHHLVGDDGIEKSKMRKIAGVVEGQEQCKKCIHHPFAMNHRTEDCRSKQENNLTRKRKKSSTAE